MTSAASFPQSLAGKRICVITPGAIGSNPRVVKEADALESAGCQVTVIATRTLDRVDARDDTLMRRIRWDVQRIDLRSRRGWRLRRVPQVAARTVYSALGLESVANMAFSPFTQALHGVASKIAADLYMAHYPAALPVAAAAARRHGARYAYDAEDFHLGDWPETPVYEIERRLVRAIESRYLPGAAYVTAASPGIADAYAQAYDIKRPTVVLNVFPLAQAPAAATAKGSAEPGPSIYWFSQTVGPDRGLECAVQAISLARTAPHLYLRGTPAAGYVERLAGLAEDVGAAGRVHLLGPAAPDDMERLAATYDVGLVSETAHTGARQTCLTNKLFSFLLAGTPPLLSDTPAHRVFAPDAGLSDLIYPRENAAALAGLIDKLLGDPVRLAETRSRCARLARQRYNWDRESGTLIEIVCGLFASAPHGG